MWSEVKINGLTLDEAAEKAGGYVAYHPDSMEADYHAMSVYCRKKGIQPMDLTEEEFEMFLFPEQA